MRATLAFVGWCAMLAAAAGAARRDACACVCGGGDDRRTRVVGGNATRPHEFPWLAGLARGGEFYCAASLITRRHVLTAAHCVNGFDARAITVVLADHDRTPTATPPTTVVRGVRVARQHRAFDSVSYNNDVAVLELDAPVEFGARVQAACLPAGGDADAFAGRLAVVAGWGRTDERGAVARVLRKVAVPVWTRQACRDAGYGTKRLTDNMLCAGWPDGGRDACQGDSGGPLHVRATAGGGHLQLVGLVSWGRGCGRPNLPGVYTRLANYVDWVKDALDGECLCAPPSYAAKRA